MQNKKIQLALAAILIICGSITGQNRTFSPYSRYGVGDLEGTSIGRGQAMGGTGIAQRSKFSLNDLNPAASTSLDSLSFMFEAGVGYLRQSVRSTDASGKYGNMNFELFAFAFPISKKVFTTLGVKPFSGTGYNIESTSGTGSDVTRTKATGEGNLSKAFLALAYKPFNNFSVGINLGYLFGTQKHFSYLDFPNASQALKYGTSKEIAVNDFTYDLGAQYTLNIDEKTRWIFGATLTPESNINGEARQIAKSGYNFSYTGDIFSNGTILSSDTTDLKDLKSKLPLQLGLGATYEIADKLSASIDYNFANWNQTPFYENVTKTMNSHSIALGAEYIPNDMKNESFLSRLRYRVGTYAKNDYLVINNHQLKDRGVTLGIGIPMRRSKNSVNLGLNWGVRGTTDHNMVRENYFGFSVNFTMHELWFAKRKFD